ncbi:hypothetical protein BSKO_06121 [Bryopsis sp. KO-2023]|nr:hypothetical protein BSKO_06121 [Bryopsis sp. KO-2023]
MLSSTSTTGAGVVAVGSVGRPRNLVARGKPSRTTRTSGVSRTLVDRHVTPGPLPSVFRGAWVARRSRADTVVVREASSSGAVRFDEDSNGNGAKLTSSSLNGAYPQNGATPQSPAQSTSVAVSTNGAKKEESMALQTTVESQGSGASVSGASSAESVDGLMDPCKAGNLNACATGVAAARLGGDSPPTTKGKVEDRWGKTQKYSAWQRTFEIWKFAFVFFFRLWWIGKKFAYPKKGFTPEAISEKKRNLANWLREGLIRLGPTFIKIGQQFSTRVDVLSQEFIKELEKLQDNVPPFDTDVAIQIVENSYGKKMSEVFEEFDRVPIAAASLGQVHLAKIKGETVVVKVQRPGLKGLFDIDLDNVRVLAQILQAMDPKSDGAARDWVAIYDECSRILYEEIDYVKEGKNADRFRENFEAVDWVKVPKIKWDYTTSEVLVMEYVPGTKINNGPEIDKLGLDRQKLAKITVESYLMQILRHGFFHADPHPGNVSVDAVNDGRLIYYDFGMMGKIPGNVRDGLVELFYGVYQRDVSKCIEALMEMGVLVKGGDMTAITRTGEYFLGQFEQRLADQRKQREENKDYNKSFKPQASEDDSKTKRKAILASIGEDLLVTAADQPFRFPAEFTFVVRAFTVLDGIGKSLDPRFDISEISAPYAREFVLEGRPQFAKLQQELGKRATLQNRAVANLFKGPNMIETMNNTIYRLERGDLKLRVRALEAERAVGRVEAWQRIMASGIMSSSLLNVGTILSFNAATAAATATFVGAAGMGLLCLVNFMKLKKMEDREKMLTGKT